MLEVTRTKSCRLPCSQCAWCTKAHFKGCGRFGSSQPRILLRGLHAEVLDPMYNSFRIAELFNSVHGALGLQDINHFLELHSALMKVSGHWHMFCSALPFKKWYELFFKEVG